MKISAAFGLLVDLRFAIRAAFLPTLSAIYNVFGNGVDENARPVKQSLIPGNAYGVVLDLGAGHGHTLFYLDPSKVTKYVALEPNQLMHGEIRTLAASKGYTEGNGNLLILPYGAEEISLITSALGAGTPWTRSSPFSLSALYRNLNRPWQRSSTSSQARRHTASLRARPEPPTGRRLVAAVLDAVVGAAVASSKKARQRTSRSPATCPEARRDGSMRIETDG
ncbi:hypothetical protein NUW54_g1536 [Trametes sanguinea]|uniref:Uncharacterized protein n=1 Tax=Trametes sanguinea TaxID=158606 RepID=A0ACC1Q8S1_9APHY|nr:hypothetical protein NUW54_g1536 [Trametes sanguinea]